MEEDAYGSGGGWRRMHTEAVADGGGCIGANMITRAVLGCIEMEVIVLRLLSTAVCYYRLVPARLM